MLKICTIKSFVISAVLLIAILLTWYLIPKSNIPLYLYKVADVSTNLKDEGILNDVAIVITSCDKRSSLWPIQFKSLFKYWPSLKQNRSFIPIYLLSNYMSYPDKRINSFTVGEDISWSDNLIRALKSIDKSYIVLLLDDYILTNEVNERRLIELTNLMKLNNAAHTEVVVDIPLLRDGVSHKNVRNLRYRRQHGEYRTSLQAGVWSRKHLLTLLRAGETPWQFETAGNLRSFNIYRPFYITSGDPVFQYENLTTASGKAEYSASKYDKGVVLRLIKKGLMMLPSSQLS